MTHDSHPNASLIARLERALAASEAQRQLLLDSSLDSIICADADARIVEFNSTAQRVFRISRSDAIGRDLPSLIFAPADVERYRQEIFPIQPPSAMELVGSRIEIDAIRGDRTSFPCELTVSRLNSDGQIKLVAHARDISARKRAEEAVVWLAAIVESSQDAIIGEDLSGRIISWNRGAEQMFGYSSLEAIGQPISLLVAPDYRDEVASILEMVKDGRRTKSVESVHVAKNGKSLNVVLTISPVCESDGTLMGASVLARDVTAEKMARVALRKATETSIYSSPMPIVAVDVNGLATIWNPAAAEVFGWSEEEVIGNRLPIIPPEEEQRAAELHSRLLSGETLTGVEVRRRKKNGSPIVVSLSGTPMWDENGLLKGIIGFLTDVTELKAAEDAWRRAEEKYRSIFENALEGIYQASPDGRYISANPALARMLGFASPQELIAQRDDIARQEYVDPELRSTLVRALVVHEAVVNFEYQARRQDGKTIWLRANARGVRDQHGVLAYFEGTVQDITEQRELERQVQQMQKIEAIGRLAGGVAHDFNNILMAISSYAELLDRKASDESTKRYVAEIAKAVNRGSSLTRGLLIFSRKQAPSLSVIDLNSLIMGQLGMLNRLIPENIELKFVPGPDTGNISADPGQIEQVILNLVINARDAMADGGTVTVQTSRTTAAETAQEFRDFADGQDFVMLTVSDHGCGMTAETKSHLFEPFYTTKDPGKGTGLGLATVFGIVRQSMGHISVQSELGQGSTFSILFPRVEEKTDVAPDEVVEVSHGEETILLVEDEQAVREPAAEYLAQQGYTVLKASQGDEALQIAKQHRGAIHLLLSDVVMPKMSGRDLAEKILLTHPEIKILFMSGYSRNLLSNTEALTPDCEILQKPLKLSVLGQRVRRALNRAQAAGA